MVATERKTEPVRESICGDGLLERLCQGVQILRGLLGLLRPR